MTVLDKTDERLKTLISSLRRKARVSRLKLWKALAEELEKPRRKRRSVNVGKLSRYGVEGRLIIVPGKVLGAGKVEKRFTVAALSFSQQAKRKIEDAGGKCVSIEEILNSHRVKEGLQILG
jgi:large subunit ribosomal protein L18e